MQTPIYYNLLATVGLSPAVVTEAIWLLANDETQPRLPKSVTIITTGAGYVAWKSRVEQTGMWTRFCEEVLAGDVLDPDIHLLMKDGRIPVERLNSGEDDLVVADMCYDLVHQLTRKFSLPLVGSIAGGFKTMSAHLMTAFCAYARPKDELIHVLGHPDLGRDFLYPSSPEEAALLLCITPPFPRLNGYLKRGFLGELPENERDLGALMDALSRYDFAPPARAAILMGKARWLVSPVEFWDASDTYLDTGQLAPQNLCTLLVLFQAMAENNGHAAADTLTGALAQERFQFIAGLLGKEHSYTPWSETRNVSVAVSRLNQQLRQLPMAETYLGIASQKDEETGRLVYHWPGNKQPNIQIYCPAHVLRKATKAGWQHRFPHLPIQLSEAAED